MRIDMLGKQTPGAIEEVPPVFTPTGAMRVFTDQGASTATKWMSSEQGEKQYWRLVRSCPCSTLPRMQPSRAPQNNIVVAQDSTPSVWLLDQCSEVLPHTLMLQFKP